MHLDTAVRNVPIYEVATTVTTGNAIIVGYGVSNSGSPQLGAGTQREGLVDITSVSGVDIFITGRRDGAANFGIFMAHRYGPFLTHFSAPYRHTRAVVPFPVRVLCLPDADRCLQSGVMPDSCLSAGTYQNACNGDSGGPIFVEKVRV